MHEIDWGQVIAQVVGFLVVLFILKKYAWGPVIDMLEERRAKIQGDFDEIDAQRAEVAAVRKGLDDRLAGIEHEARERIQAAVAEGESVGNEIKLKARQEAQAIQRRAEEQVERDRDKAQVALRNEMVTMVVAATEKMLRENAEVVTGEMKEKVEASIKDLREALNGDDAGAIKTRTEALSAAMQEVGAAIYGAQQAANAPGGGGESAPGGGQNGNAGSGEGEPDTVEGEFREV